ncbi:Na+/H+ antiporter NhaC family protein [Brucepastera parasyntrophica]|uniref:Na+/H+ antiporter NhaC family protein n=1 Tax=Brucepastera parasyntrophica TaxID=2880008 RepID=UPI00210CAADE|nr:Na+/H+ antiporter NhaC family protein [Brucepastera parasyntrophica]ULQ59205.1 Na+/H+ antiporter NhaC family protein [Brucepastera parasyntrophica]
MEHFGAWGLIPPLLTIALALITKDVIISLFLGILSGALIVAGGNPALALMNTTDMLADSLNDGWNIRIFLFCALLGGLVGMLSRTGASHALGTWASNHLKTRKTSQLMAWFLGLLIFIDDYFNSLAVGTIMRPITDKQKISRAKLAYILDSTAAPVCIIAPISSWVVTVMSVVKGSEGFGSLGISEFSFFIRSIPYNLYALLTLVMVLILILSGRDFGPMAASEKMAKEQGLLWNEKKFGPPSGEVEHIENSRAKPFDMLFPIIVLIITAVVFFPVTTWMGAVDGETITSFGQAVSSMSLATAFNDTDASVALFYAVIFTIVITYIYYMCRRLLNIKTAAASLKDGISSMVPALIILTMAWTIGGIIKYTPDEGGLGLANFLSETVVNGGFPIWLLPCIAFILSALISFSTGTSWGTFTIMIPIVMPIAVALAGAKGLEGAPLLNAAMISVAAVLSGAVFGDHSSPISDTTILSSTGAGCPHLEHVTTQMPYAVFVAICSLVGFIAGGLALNTFIGWAGTLVVFAAGMIFLPRLISQK